MYFYCDIMNKDILMWITIMAQKKATSLKEEAVKDKKTAPKKVVLKAVDASHQDPIKSAPKAKHIGDVLKVVRQSKALSIKEIGATLRISERYLDAIESMDASALPGQVYALGFVRSYAHYLGVDPQKTVAQFKSEIFADSAGIKTLYVPKHIDFTSLPTQKILMSLAVVLAVFLVVGYVCFGKSSPSLEDEITTLLVPVDSLSPAIPEFVAPSFDQGEPKVQSPTTPTPQESNL